MYHHCSITYTFVYEYDQFICGEIITGFNEFEIVYFGKYYHFHIKRKVMTFGYANFGEFESWGSH